MQHSDERPTTSGRPSLLSTEQQAEANRHRILGGLDGAPAARGTRRRRGKYGWLAAGVAVLALGAGGAWWLDGESDKQIVRAGTAPLPATAAAAASVAPEPVAAIPETPEPAASAEIVDDAQVVASKTTLPVPMKMADDEVVDARDVAPVVLTSKTPARRAAAETTPPKAVTKHLPRTAVASNMGAAARKKSALVATPKPGTPSDSDVALLSALVAHSKATQPKGDSVNAAKLVQCRTLPSVAEAEQCRVRLCGSVAQDEAECKTPGLAKTASGL